MKALRFERFGGPDVLAVTEVPKPVPGAGEVLVRIRASGLNPSDAKNVQGRFHETTLPRIPGRDFCGVVERGPAEWLGRDVWGTGAPLGFTRDGTHAEYILMPTAGLNAKPAFLSFAQAASCGVPYTTAWNALERAHVDAETKLVVVGAGAVGSAAIAMARARGATVVAAVRQTDVSASLRNSGVPIITLSDAESFVADVEGYFPTGANVVFDSTGYWIDSAVPALAKFGLIATISAPVGGYVSLPVLDLYRRGGVLVGVNSLLYGVEACATMLESIAALFDNNKLPLPMVIRETSLDDAAAAYGAVSNGTKDKYVFVMP